jgi:hypothetical protein
MRFPECIRDRFGNSDPSDLLLEHLDREQDRLEALDRDLRAKRRESVYMEERVRLGVEIERVARELCSAIGKGER